MKPLHYDEHPEIQKEGMFWLKLSIQSQSWTGTFSSDALETSNLDVREERSMTRSRTVDNGVGAADKDAK